MREYDISGWFDSLEHAIQAIRPGRALVVAQCSVLGRNAAEQIDAVKRIADRGGHLIEAATGRDTQGGWSDVFAMGVETRKRAPLSPDRARDMAQKYTDADIEKAAKMWSRKSLTNEFIAKKTGIPVTTLWRRLGPRGMKAGRKPAKR